MIITVSNPDVKTGWGRVLAYKSGREIGEFYYGTEEYEGNLVYVNGNPSITGSHTDNSGEVEKYNVHLKKRMEHGI